MKPADQIMAMTAALMAVNGDVFSEFYPQHRDREPKNKFNLSPEQLEQMSTMSPKEKKKFLRGLNEPSA